MKTNLTAAVKMHDGEIRWERTLSGHRVSYGHHVAHFRNGKEAATEFAACIHQSADAAGLFSPWRDASGNPVKLPGQTSRIDLAKKA